MPYPLITQEYSSTFSKDVSPELALFSNALSSSYTLSWAVGLLQVSPVTFSFYNGSTTSLLTAG